MKKFSKKSFLQKSLAMLFAMFLLGACSTAGDTSSGDTVVERDPKNFADYGYRMLYVNNTEEKYIALGDEPSYYYTSFGPYQVIEATTTYLEIRSGEDTIYTYSKSADETIPDEIKMTGLDPVHTKYLGD